MVHITKHKKDLTTTNNTVVMVRPTIQHPISSGSALRRAPQRLHLCYITKVPSWTIFLTILAVAFLSINLFSLHLLSNTDNTNTNAINNNRNSNLRNSIGSNNVIEVAYAISLTGCGDDSLTDGGAVLKHSIHLSSALNVNANGNSRSNRYGYKMYAIVHPNAIKCSAQLKDIGYEILIRDIPIPVKDIEGEYLRTRVESNGCCGEKEFIKLWAYTLTQHPIVVHMDLDTMVLQPMDDLFDGMLLDLKSAAGKEARSRIPVMFQADMPNIVDAYFTRDYNMNNPKNSKPALVQGGFLVLRPSMKSFETYKEIIRKGDFRPGSGWGGKGYAAYGAMTFQGIVPYFYDEIKPNTSTELSRCIYNAQADNPRTLPSHTYGDCRDGQPDCQDCRDSNVSTVISAHFTLCQKPWNCLPHNDYDIRHKLCRIMHHEWFRIRRDLEDSWYAKTMDESIKERQKGKFQPDQFYGFCNKQGAKGYISMKVPITLK